jgi:hypothetical protein
MRTQEVASKEEMIFKRPSVECRLFQDAVLTADVAWRCMELQIIANIG